MDKVEIIKCLKCNKPFKRITIRFPAKMEGSRFWDTFYCCPYCKEAYKIHLNGDEDIRTEKLEDK